MKKIVNIILSVSAIIIISCNEAGTESEKTAGGNETVVEPGGQASVRDDVSAKDVVKIASGSKDHSTLVATLKQAGLVNALSNAGPFTVFLPRPMQLLIKFQRRHWII